MIDLNDKVGKLQYVIDFSWAIFIDSLISKKITINLEASMQLYYSSIINNLGDLLLTRPDEKFKIELEHDYNDSYKYIDIQCSYDDIKAAIELKCFRKNSNRAKDIDMYDALKDIERLQNFKEHKIKKFICLTDNITYLDGKHSGHASAVSIKDGRVFSPKQIIIPTWKEKWQNKTRDKPIEIEKQVIINWVRRDPWYYLNIDL